MAGILIILRILQIVTFSESFIESIFRLLFSFCRFEIVQSIYDKIMENLGDKKWVTSFWSLFIKLAEDFWKYWTLIFSIPIVVVGNKLDLHFNARHVSTEEGRQLAVSWNAAFLETSAKDNTVSRWHILFDVFPSRIFLQTSFTTF